MRRIVRKWWDVISECELGHPIPIVEYTIECRKCGAQYKTTALEKISSRCPECKEESEREKRLEKLVRSLYADYYSECPDRAEEAYTERMKELGIEVIVE